MAIEGQRKDIESRIQNLADLIVRASRATWNTKVVILWAHKRAAHLWKIMASAGIGQPLFPLLNGDFKDAIPSIHQHGALPLVAFLLGLVLLLFSRYQPEKEDQNKVRDCKDLHEKAKKLKQEVVSVLANYPEPIKELRKLYERYNSAFEEANMAGLLADPEKYERRRAMLKTWLISEHHEKWPESPSPFDECQEIVRTTTEDWLDLNVFETGKLDLLKSKKKQVDQALEIQSLDNVFKEIGIPGVYDVLMKKRIKSEQSCHEGKSLSKPSYDDDILFSMVKQVIVSKLQQKEIR